MGEERGAAFWRQGARSLAGRGAGRGGGFWRGMLREQDGVWWGAGGAWRRKANCARVSAASRELGPMGVLLSAA